MDAPSSLPMPLDYLSYYMGCVYGYLHYRMWLFGDDLYFAQVNIDFWNWSKSRAEGWTSRAIIEGLVYLFIHELPFYVFKIINFAMVVSTPCILASIVSDNKIRIQDCIVPSVLLCAAYPVMDMSTAGWQATLINYFWVLYPGLLFAIVFKMYLLERYVPLWKYVLAIACLLVVANQELASIVALILLFTFFIVFRRRNFFIILSLCIVLCGIIYTIFCPGNHARLISEIQTWMPNFSVIPILEKLYNGYTSTMVFLFCSLRKIILPFIILLAMMAFIRNKSYIVRSASLFPLVIVFLPSVSYRQYAADYFTQYVVFFLSFIVIACVTISVFSIFGRREAWLIFALLAAGFSTRFALAMSPTLYASDTRTFIFLDASIIIATLWLYARGLSEPGFTERIATLSLDIVKNGRTAVFGLTLQKIFIIFLLVLVFRHLGR